MKKEGRHFYRNFAYGAGSLGDSLSYNLFYSYFIYFLTTIAGIRPAIAGVISFIAVVWDAVTDPIIGYYSDNSRFRAGRRSPFLLAFSIPLGLTVFALFQNPNISDTGKIVYYLIVNILFWLFFTCTDIPYLAFGADLTTDYDERTKIRKWARIFMSFGDIAVVAGTLPLIELFTQWQGSRSQAWGTLGGLYGGISAAAFFITGFLLRKYDAPSENRVTSYSLKTIFREFPQILKIREYQKIVLISFLTNLIIGIGSSTNMYMWTYIFQFDSAQISFVGLIGTVCALFASFTAEGLSAKMGKKTTGIVSFLLIVGGYVILYFCPHTLPFAILAQIIKLHGVSMFWTIVYSMTYDIAEVDEFKNGSRREGLLTSVNSFFMKLGVSVGMGAAGISLDLIHFDPTKSVQGEQMLQNLSSMIMFVPMAIAVLGILICRQYKITKENHRLLKEALRRRQEGLPYATEGIEEITK